MIEIAVIGFFKGEDGPKSASLQPSLRSDSVARLGHICHCWSLFFSILKNNSVNGNNIIVMRNYRDCGVLESGELYRF
jgi:hypothetical protein